MIGNMNPNSNSQKTLRKNLIFRFERLGKRHFVFYVLDIEDGAFGVD